MKHRVLSLVLALVLLVSLCPTSALAAEFQPSTGIQTAQIVHVNPLYADVIDPSQIAPARTSVPGIQTMATGDYLSEAEVAGEIREYMKDRTEYFTVYLRTTNSDIEAVTTAVIDAAMVHTGNPIEGDYLMWQYGYWSASMSWSSSGGIYNVQIDLELSYYTSAAQEAEMDRAISSLLNQLNLDGASDYEKVCTIYDYLCYNVTYDYENLEDDSYTLKYTAYAALVNGTAVCQGYAVLLYRLALALDVDARVIVGIGNGGPHAWNIIELKNLYYNADSTWDASYAEAGMDYGYFLVCDANFDDHYRDDEYNTTAFYAEYPMDDEDYVHVEEPDPTEPAPTEPAPTEPAPTEPAPTEPAPTEPAPTEPDPTDPTEPEHEHSFGPWVTIWEPTSEKEGLEKRFCACGEEESRVLPKLTNPFSDVKKSDYFFEPVLWAVNKGITSGVSAAKFGPNNSCTRGQIVTFLWAAKGRPEPASTANPFTDVKASDYYYKAVLWAVENGITSGVSATKFGPNNTCTRGQVVTFLWAAKGRPEPASTSNYFSDVKSSDYYFKAVLWAVENSITSGVGAGRFGPGNTCTRGQIVTFLYKAFAGQPAPDEVPDKEPAPDEKPEAPTSSVLTIPEYSEYVVAACALDNLAEQANTYSTIYVDYVYYTESNSAGYPMVIIEVVYENIYGTEERMYATALASVEDIFDDCECSYHVDEAYYVGCDTYSDPPYTSLEGFETLDVDTCIEVYENMTFS